MTEQEAKTKACCGPRQHRYGNAPYDSACIGSACMAWREFPVEDNRPRELWDTKANKRVNSGSSPDVVWRLVEPADPLPAAHGWCGLAGKP